MVNSLTLYPGAQKAPLRAGVKHEASPSIASPSAPQETLSSVPQFPLLRSKPAFGNYFNKLFRGESWTSLQEIKKLEE